MTKIMITETILKQIGYLITFKYILLIYKKEVNDL